MTIKYIMASTVLWWGGAVAFPLYAQQPEAPTLGNLWPQVKDYYAGVGVKAAAVSAAKFRDRAIKSAQLPQLKAQAQNTYGTYERTAGAFFPQEGFFNVSGGGIADGSTVVANSFGSATLTWELFSFGKLRNQSEAAGMLLQNAISDRDAYLLRLKKLLSERYIRLLYSDAKLHWAIRNAERLQEIRNITAGLAAAGLRPAADSLLATASYIQAKAGQDKWDGRKSAALIRLLELYGRDRINYAASAERFSNPEERKTEIRHFVAATHPALASLTNKAAYYRLSGAAQKKSSLPSLRLLGGYAYSGTGHSPDGVASGRWIDGFHHTTHNFIAGIGITWNLSGLYTNRLKASALAKVSEQTELLYTQTAQTMQADLSAAQVSLRRQYDQVEKTSLSVLQSQQAFDRYLARYKSGLIALSELLQIRLLLQQAENAHIEASRDYWLLLAKEAELTADFDFLFHNL